MKKREAGSFSKENENYNNTKYNLVLIFFLVGVLLTILISINLISAQNYSVNVTSEHSFLLSNGSYVAASELHVGDNFLTTEGKTAKIISVKNQDLPPRENMPAKVTDIFTFLRNDYYVIKTDSSAEEIKVTGEHPFFVGGNWVLVKDLKVGDELLTPSGEKTKITSIEKVHSDKPFKVYNLEVDSSHTYYADGVLVHNKPMPYRDPVDSVYKYPLTKKIAYAKELLGSLTPDQTDAIIDVNQKGFSTVDLKGSEKNPIFSEEQIKLLLDSGVFGDAPRDPYDPYQTILKLAFAKESDRANFLKKYAEAQKDDPKLGPKKAIPVINLNSEFVQASKPIRDKSNLQYGESPTQPIGRGSVSDLTPVYDAYFIARSTGNGERILIDPYDGKPLNGEWYILILSDGNAYISHSFQDILTKYPFAVSNGRRTQVLPVDCFELVTFKNGVPEISVEPIESPPNVFISYEKALDIFFKSLIQSPNL